MEPKNRGLLLNVLNPHDLADDPDDEYPSRELDRHGRFFTVAVCEMPVCQFVSMQFRQGMAPETAITILRQAITLLETEGREILSHLHFDRDAGYLDCEGEIVWEQGACHLDVEEIIDHLPPESQSDADWLEDPFGWLDGPDDLGNLFEE